MRLVFGIGNPGSRYENNRHNVGFMLLDKFSGKYSINFYPSKFNYYCANGELKGEEFALIKPTTFVNDSGYAVKQAIEYFNVSINDILVVVDDVNLSVASFRVRSSGGDGGHNGLNSIIYNLKSEQFPRIRIGIGNRFEKGEMAGYVLSNFDKEELQLLNNTFDDCISLVEAFITGGIKEMLDTNSNLK